MDDYNNAIDNIMSGLKKDLLKERPLNPSQFIINRLTRNNYSIPDPDIVDIPLNYPPSLGHFPLSIVIFGASGDLAKKKTFPALFGLFLEGLLPTKKFNQDGSLSDGKVVITSILGFARSKFSTQEDFCQILRPYLPKNASDIRIKEFFSLIRYIQSDSYTDKNGYDKLRNVIETHEQEIELPTETSAFISCLNGSLLKGKTGQKGNRLYYLALPPDAFISTLTAIKTNLMVDESGAQVFFNRLIIEKPFGHDSLSSMLLSSEINKLFKENQIFRIDHYLGKEMVQNVVSLRFANHVFSSLWNYKHINSIIITFKEKIGTEGRGGYFDKFGVIRDIIQNHLTQILALIAMEKPKTLAAEHIRDEKVALLRCVEVVREEDCVLGQYTASADGKISGYLDDPGVPKDSKCPTFAALRLRINNDRWQGVNFVIKAGKALEDKSVVVRIQFRDEIRPFLSVYPGTSSTFALSKGDEEEPPDRNELVIRAQPNESIYLKINTKRPGVTSQNDKSSLILSELDLTYSKRFNVNLPDAYHSLINEALLGNTTNFVRSDELETAWAIYTPLLHKIDAGEVKVIPYQAGTRGPVEADEMLLKAGYRRSKNYAYNLFPEL